MAIAVDLPAARRQLRIEADDVSRDDDLHDLIDRAAGWVERYTGHIIDAREVTEQFDGFGRLELRAWPIKPDAVPSLIYETATGPQTLTARINTSRRPARVMTPLGTRWPWIAAVPVTVTVRAGYEVADPIPANMRSAMLVLITAYDEDREGGEVLEQAEATARRLCRDFRLMRV